ncbi:unnamed protein product [Parnassius mnemosyne]|uniref:Uncharacterized protein n=1 Tax=Parnassius mnemosyne TaxID=213953 RepID=A0AAV1LI79_9NEOP
MNFENITVRKNKTILNSPNSSFESTNSDYLSKSLPQLSSSLSYEEFERLKEEIEQLRMQLNTANNERDNLIMENNTLKKQTAEQQNTITNLKKICSETQSSTKKNSTIKKQRCKVKNLNIVHRKKLDMSFIDLETKSSEGNTTEFATRNMSKNGSSQVHKLNFKKCDQYKTDGAILNLHEENKVINNQQPFKPIDNKTKSQLIIFGGQQFTGLATLLIQSRNNNQYKDYQVFSTTKPYATTEEILKSIYKLNDCEDNYLIICIGENDTNPNKIIIELVSMLKYLKKTKILVFNVLQNRKKAKIEYTTIPKKGTIPFYFKSCKNVHSGDNCQEVNSTTAFLNKMEIVNTETHKKGTIPYYFKKSIPCLNRQPDPQLPLQAKTCFRP